LVVLREETREPAAGAAVVAFFLLGMVVASDAGEADAAGHSVNTSPNGDPRASQPKSISPQQDATQQTNKLRTNQASHPIENDLIYAHIKSDGPLLKRWTSFSWPPFAFSSSESTAVGGE
jgi:hypothetical protein